MTQVKTTNQFLSETEYNYIADIIEPYVEPILDSLNCEFSSYKNRLNGCCPVHNGDNKTACVIWLDGHTIKLNWKCYTHSCEHKWGLDFFGLVAGALTSNTNRTHSKMEAYEYVCKLLKINPVKPQIDKAALEQLEYNRQLKIFSQDKKPEAYRIPRKMVRQSLIIPPVYYLNKNYSKEVLDFFDVGVCQNRAKKFYNRVVVPVYEDTGNFMTGCTSRTQEPKCLKCNLFHTGDCPTDGIAVYRASKWIHDNIEASKSLYNYWHAKKYIEEYNIAVIVESPGDIWRLWEAGVYNCVAVYGKKLHDAQTTLLDKACTLTLKVILNTDKAGQEGQQKIAEEYKRRYYLKFPLLLKDYNDIGDMPLDILKERLGVLDD